MKKNAMLKVAAVVLVAVLLTTCAISATFAKYVTENVTKSSAEARVAKWGVEVNTTALATLDTLFLKEYNSDGNDADGAEEVVSFELADEVVAPGTYNMITIDSVATGKPEVSGQITTTADLKLANWTVADDVQYCPLVFYVNKTPISNVTSMADLETAVENAIKQAGTKAFDANEDLEAEKYTITIEWEWLFEGTNDVNDTYLADKTTNVPTVSLDITVGVEQTGAAAVRPAQS